MRHFALLDYIYLAQFHIFLRGMKIIEEVTIRIFMNSTWTIQNL